MTRYGNELRRIRHDCAGISEATLYPSPIAAPSQLQATIRNSVVLAIGRTWRFSRLISTNPWLDMVFSAFQ